MDRVLVTVYSTRSSISKDKQRGQVVRTYPAATKEDCLANKKCPDGKCVARTLPARIHMGIVMVFTNCDCDCDHKQGRYQPL